MLFSLLPLMLIADIRRCHDFRHDAALMLMPPLSLIRLLLPSRRWLRQRFRHFQMPLLIFTLLP